MPKVKTLFKSGPPRHFIREWRNHRGYTLEDLAEKVGVTHGALSQLERGLVSYTQPMLETLAQHLSCDPADLIMRKPDSELWSIVDQLKRLPVGDQDQVRKIVETFRKAG